MALFSAATAGCGGSSPHSAAAAQIDPLALGAVQVLARQSLRAGVPSLPAMIQRALPARFAVSMDLALARGAVLELGLGSAKSVLTLTRGAGGRIELRDGKSTYALGARSGWPHGDSRHIELTSGALAIDGRRLDAPAQRRRRGAVLSLRMLRGGAKVTGLIISDAGRRASLLLHRLAELHARVRPGALLVGSDRRDGLHFRSPWTSGFFAGALWQAASLVPQDGLFAGWALAATLGHVGLEHSGTHDVGFMYGQSSLPAWRHLCATDGPPRRLCDRLRGSVLAAAQELKTLAAGDPGAGTIPTRAGGSMAETIVDSMMNIEILPWASRVTHDRSYAQLASHQAHVISSLLVRPDGSTYQAVHFDRATGRIVFVGTHQGISDSSTWARGQGWALYGFAQAARDLRDGQLLSVAQLLAGYTVRQLPAAGVPPWDYSAPTGRPLDVSAGVIQAAGFLRLLSACDAMPGACSDTSAYVPAARTLLTGALRRARDRPPLGLLGSQVLNPSKRGCCNGGELIFGLSYALEALVLERQLGG